MPDVHGHVLLCGACGVRVAGCGIVKRFSSATCLGKYPTVFGFDNIDTVLLVWGKFQFWQQRLGGFDLDTFVDKSTAQLLDFGLQVCPFHSLDLHGCWIWAFPPWQLVSVACTTILASTQESPQTLGLVLVLCDHYLSWWHLCEKFTVLHHYGVSALILHLQN